MKYQIIDKPAHLQPWGQWVRLFRDLPFGKAVLFDFEDKQRAKLKGMSIQSSLRVKRRRLGFSVHWRVLPNGEHYQLYVWKEAEKEGEL